MPVDLNRLREIAPDVVGWISMNATVETASREWLTANGIFDTDRLLHGLDAIRAAEVPDELPEVVEEGHRYAKCACGRRLPPSYIPFNLANELYDALVARGYDKRGHGNTLWSMFFLALSDATTAVAPEPELGDPRVLNCGCGQETCPICTASVQIGEPSHSLRVAAEALLEAYRQATCDVEEMPAEMFEAFTEVRNLRAALLTTEPGEPSLEELMGRLPPDWVVQHWPGGAFAVYNDKKDYVDHGDHLREVLIAALEEVEK